MKSLHTQRATTLRDGSPGQKVQAGTTINTSGEEQTSNIFNIAGYRAVFEVGGKAYFGYKNPDSGILEFTYWNRRKLYLKPGLKIIEKTSVGYNDLIIKECNSERLSSRHAGSKAHNNISIVRCTYMLKMDHEPRISYYNCNVQSNTSSGDVTQNVYNHTSTETAGQESYLKRLWELISNNKLISGVILKFADPILLWLTALLFVIYGALTDDSQKTSNKTNSEPKATIITTTNQNV
jgi:hypothetical protein